MEDFPESLGEKYENCQCEFKPGSDEVTQTCSFHAELEARLATSDSFRKVMNDAAMTGVGWLRVGSDGEVVRVDNLEIALPDTDSEGGS